MGACVQGRPPHAAAPETVKTLLDKFSSDEKEILEEIFNLRRVLSKANVPTLSGDKLSLLQDWLNWKAKYPKTLKPYMSNVLTHHKQLVSKLPFRKSEKIKKDLSK